MNPRNFSLPQLAAELKKLLSRNGNASWRYKGFVGVSDRYGPRLILFATITAFFLSSLSGLPNQGFSRGAQVSASSESISTFRADCSTASTSLNLGETACAVAVGAQLPISGRRQRRFQWVAPDGSVVQQADITSSPQSDSFVIPATGQFAQVGTWFIKTVDNGGAGFDSASFVVLNPANASVDLSVIKNGPFQAAAGSNVTYTIYVTNRGPDDAQSVVLTDGVPPSTTFVSETQLSGPAATCTNPTSGSSTGATVCTIATLPANATAIFSITYNMNAGTQDGTEISNTATVASSTPELHEQDNTVVALTTVTAGVQTCAVTCPGDITQASPAGQCVAAVSYSVPTGSGDNCGVVECSPPSGSIFPSGTTTVTCAGQTGDPCNFTVTVTGDDAQPPAITCPDDVTTESVSSGGTRVDYPEPGATDNCSAVTVSCAPPSGSVFPTGATTVTCTARDSSNNSA
ncbi:MAG TPA: HYR domain-containing protein, partial [Blastocatellia bacterium]